MALVFYDTETTGLNTTYDQILQFAAVRTDYELNPLDRFEVKCCLQTHVVPSPKALLLNGVTAARLYDTSLPSHYEMICAVRAKLTEWSPANFVGFNSIAFDEHILRQALYQSLHPPYLTNRPGNARSDIMRMLQAASVLAPGSLTIPIGENGRPTFRLGLVAAANGFVGGRAHDAMADVKATLYLARIVMDKASEVWSAAMRFSQKAAVVEYVKNEHAFCLFEHFNGEPHAWFTTYLGPNLENGAECFLYDLSVNPAELASLDDVALASRIAVYPRPVRLLKTNGAPILLPVYEAPDFVAGRDLDEGELSRRASLLSGDPALRARLIAAYQGGRSERVKSKHPEGQIYDGFTSDDDLAILEEFHASPWSARPALLARLKDGRLRKLGRRLIYAERRDLLTESVRAKYERAIARRILGADPDTEWLTVHAALEELSALLPHEGNAAHLADYLPVFLALLARARTEANSPAETNGAA